LDAIEHERKTGSKSFSVHSHQQSVEQMAPQAESSEDIVARIYEEQLSKLAELSKQSGNLAEYRLYQVGV